MRFDFLSVVLTTGLSYGSPAIAGPLGYVEPRSSTGTRVGVEADASISDGGEDTVAHAKAHKAAAGTPGEIGDHRPIPLLSESLSLLGDLLGLNITTGITIGSQVPGDVNAGAHICIECTCYGGFADTGLGSTGHGDVDTHAGANARIWFDERVSACFTSHNYHSARLPSCIPSSMLHRYISRSGNYH